MLAQYRVEQFDGEVIPYRQYKEKQKQRKAFFRKQKACGILLVAIAAAAPFLIGRGVHEIAADLDERIEIVRGDKAGLEIGDELVG